MNKLYNKYRPTKWEEMLPNFDKEVLQNLIINKSYQYRREFLFSSKTGGTGKTTSAMIMAKAINCKNPVNGNPCNECEHCKLFDKNKYPDFIFLKGMEYNSVQKIKPVTELCSQLPFIKEGYKIVIIDEVHRVSPEALSEFLSILEFGHNKTIFIFTTTNINKIPQPIISRMLSFEFGDVPRNLLVNHLKQICNSENVEYDLSTLKRVSVLSDGSIREALSSMDKYILAYGTLKNVPISTQYDVIVETILEAFEYSILDLEYKFYENSKAFNSLFRILVELSQSEYHPTSLISKEIYDKFNDSLSNNIKKTLIKSILKYKPSSIKEFVLFLDFFVTENSSGYKKIITQDLITNIKQNTPPKLENSKSKNVEQYLINNGFIKIKG
jgi:DNA polymerase III subunit gamma/tau